jgi:uncharacterized protein YbjT (DUF2867 family)
MRAIVFGATGMVGQAVLRACLRDPEVERVLVVVRTPAGQTSEKVEELIHGDFFDWSGVATTLTGYDACLFCLGVSSAGMKEPEYHRVTYELTMAVASALVRVNPGMTFIYVSGAGTDESERGRSMWARVKGKTENALLAMPFARAYMFRPGFIQPEEGVISKTPLYRAIYAVSSPLFPVLKALFPRAVSSSGQVARAMLEVAKRGSPVKRLESTDINALTPRQPTP